jgi:hypothetical protein
MNPPPLTLTLRRRKPSQREVEAAAVLQFNKILLDCKTALRHTSKDMNEREYLRLKADFAAKRKARIDAADADYKREMDALEIVRSASQSSENKHELSELTKSKIVISDLVKQVLPMLDQEFTSFDIERAIEKKFPEAKGTYKHNSLSGTISRLKKRKVIEVVKEGSGPEGNVYRIKK